MELIDKETAIKAVTMLLDDPDDVDLIWSCDVINNLRYAPTADAEPVRHGRWTDGEDQYWLRATCSVCGSHPWRGFIPSAEMLMASGKYNYCPTCGAKMDGGLADGKDA